MRLRNPPNKKESELLLASINNKCESCQCCLLEACEVVKKYRERNNPFPIDENPFFPTSQDRE